MASKGPRHKLDHETKARRQKALEAPREPRRSKTHWDHVIEEMVWLSKDFESERKWKLAQARKVALKASRGMLDQATRGEKKLKEEEQRMRKVALNISKDVKKFWIKIEKLVLYKHQMELDEKRKKALDKQLEFLLGQTERYSTMLAENLVGKPSQPCSTLGLPCNEGAENGIDDPAISNDLTQQDVAGNDEDFELQSGDESEDDEHTIEEDEAPVTEEEKQEELAALQNESNLPLEVLLKRYATAKVSGEDSPKMSEDGAYSTSEEEDGAISTSEGEDAANSTSDGEADVNSTLEGGVPCESEDNVIDGSPAIRIDRSSSSIISSCHCVENNAAGCASENPLLEIEASITRNLPSTSLEPPKAISYYDFNEEPEDDDFDFAAGEEKDDEITLVEEEELAKDEPINPADEIAVLQRESEIPLEELIARYKKDDEPSQDGSEYASPLSDNLLDTLDNEELELKQLEVSTDENFEAVESVCVASHIKEDGPDGEKISGGNQSENRIADAAAAARSAQPTGNTFSTTKVRTKFPFLLKYPLREYQHIGLDWLVTMYEKRLNGILADEMGLGKTIMTIALLAHLACEKGIWGPHLIVVPTSVMLNWETEFLKWCPAFKILTYFGSAKERKFKRQGWLKPNSFHVCITTYRLIIQDSKVFKRKKWKYLILDEAHLIKNWKSQRWQTLLNFNSKRRVLLTGTPLQNDLMELWSLMHFLMPHIFQSHQEFKDWFSNPISGMVEGQERVNKEVVDRLHNVLRPFILRRLKRDVEKQLPMKHEHVIYCKLSRRQRNLYEDFIASADTQATLASANFFGMISIIMQLRKVCNHPDLFEGRPIISSFDMDGLDIQLSSSVCTILSPDLLTTINLQSLGLIFTDLDFNMTSWEYDEVKAIATPVELIEEGPILDCLKQTGPGCRQQEKFSCSNIFEDIRRAVLDEQLRKGRERAASVAWWNSLRCQKKPIYSTTMRELLTIRHPVYDINSFSCSQFSKLHDVVLSPVERFQRMINLVESFMFAIPAARAPVPVCWCSKTGAPVFLSPSYKDTCSETLLPLLSPIRPSIVRRQLYFPDRRLIQFDCGKLQQLAVLLRKLKSAGHRALIFTQMTKMLDILEAFINLYGYTYMRLDGSTQPEERQTLMQRFNTNPKIFLFILSTRSGGVGINLVGADTVIFYDSDWNPAMDQQAQDRCHRIGQTREVHIYRLISESTIEENILKKANQKRALDDLVIQSGGYNTEFFKKLDPLELFSGHKSLAVKTMEKDKNGNCGDEASVSNADVEAALKFVEDEADYMALKKVELEEAVDNQEFSEDAIVRMEDDEFVNEDDAKADEPTDKEMMANNKERGLNFYVNNTFEERGSTFAGNEDNIDMLADVKQMAAAAAAAGQDMSSFEYQLRPIDRYAVRFMEFWDPIIDKAAAESQVSFEERAWELERIEKYKEEMEAEIDEDEEPFVYERWDSEFATEAYRQQVETLAQHQLMEELEAKAKQKKGADDEHIRTLMNETSTNAKPKPRKKTKKAKFKYLKKGSLTSELKCIKDEQPVGNTSSDGDAGHLELEVISQSSNAQKKRKKAKLTCDDEEQKNAKNKSKKFKKTLSEFWPSDLDSNLCGMQVDDILESKPCGKMVVNAEHKAASRNRMGGRISITAMPVKRVLIIKPEKSKKGCVLLRDFVPTPDSWLPQEDAILCAVVHEYGPHWSLASETLYGMSAGGFYRGRYRHPAHCCERFRELFQRYVLSSPENLFNEKMNHAGSGKALLKVTEDNMKALLNVAAEKPDSELLLQRHFTALLSSVWKVSHVGSHQKHSSPLNSANVAGKYLSTVHQLSGNSVEAPAKRAKLTTEYSSKLLAAALHDANTNTGQPDERVIHSSEREHAPFTTELLELTLEFLEEEADSPLSLPSMINLSIPDSHTQTSINRDFSEHHLKGSTNLAENRLRDAARASFEGECGLGWVSHGFAANDPKSEPQKPSKSLSLGKHKFPVSDSIKPPGSKLKRTSIEHSDIHQIFALPPLQTPGCDSNLSFLLTSVTNTDNWIDDISLQSLPVDDELYLEMRSLEPVLNDYNAGFTSDVDFSLLADYTDIG